MSRQVRAGAVSVNASVDGAQDSAPALGLEPTGRSGFGADYGEPSLLQFTQLKQITFSTK